MRTTTIILFCYFFVFLNPAFAQSYLQKKRVVWTDQAIMTQPNTYLEGKAPKAWVNPPVQLPANVDEWLYNEMLVNPGNDRDNVRPDGPLHLEYAEVPLNLLSKNIAQNVRPEIYNSLIFERDGQQFVRWIFNPEGARYKEEFLQYWRQQFGSDLIVHNDRYVGYLTASRSTLAHDVKTGVIFSFKASTHMTGGEWRNKPMTKYAAWVARAYSDYFEKYNNVDKPKTFVPILEPVAFSFDSLDQALVIRDYPIFTNQKLRMMPFFTAMDIEFADNFAREKNSDPELYWKKYLMEAWGRSEAERAAYYGSFPNSDHAQDHLIELDQKGNPTGRIYDRDIMDSHADQMILTARGAYSLIDLLSKSKGLLKLWKGKILTKINLHNGHSYPRSTPEWSRDESFLKVYTEAFNRTYTDITGVENLRAIGWSATEKQVYNDPNFKKWVKNLESASGSALKCDDIFKLVK